MWSRLICQSENIFWRHRDLLGYSLRTEELVGTIFLLSLYLTKASRKYFCLLFFLASGPLYLPNGGYQLHTPSATLPSVSSSQRGTSTHLWWLVLVAAVQGTPLCCLALETMWVPWDCNNVFMPYFHPKCTAHTADENTPLVFLKKRSTDESRSFSWTGFRFAYGIGLRVYKPGHAMSPLSLCLTAFHQYLPERSLYTHLEPQFLQPLPRVSSK